MTKRCTSELSIERAQIPHPIALRVGQTLAQTAIAVVLFADFRNRMVDDTEVQLSWLTREVGADDFHRPQRGAVGGGDVTDAIDGCGFEGKDVEVTRASAMVRRSATSSWASR
jgi:hypothetical protein